MNYCKWCCYFCGHSIEEHTSNKKICFGDYGSCDCMKFEDENDNKEEK